jgi:hypothetical protein
MAMIFDPVRYMVNERDPVGCFTAEMTSSGWANTKFDHDLQTHLLSDEVSEFIRCVESFFKECSDWQKLEKYAAKHGTQTVGDDYSASMAFSCVGKQMDYSFFINGNSLSVFPYRKFRRH